MLLISKILVGLSIIHNVLIVLSKNEKEDINTYINVIISTIVYVLLAQI